MIKTIVPRAEKRRELGFCTDDVLIGFTGRLVPIKGLDTLLEAFRLMLVRDERVRLLLVGDGPLRGRLEELCHNIGIAQKVHFLGQREDIYDIINMLDMLVLPSRHEGISMTLLECLYLGIPVIATAVGGNCEIMSGPLERFLVPPDSPGELATSCCSMLKDHKNGQYFKKIGPQRILSSFTVEKAVDQHFTEYEAKEVGLSLNLHYEDLVNCLLPVQCARSKPATDADEVLFKGFDAPTQLGLVIWQAN